MTRAHNFDDPDGAKRRARWIDDTGELAAEAFDLASKPIKEADGALSDEEVRDLAEEPDDGKRRQSTRSAVENAVLSTDGGSRVATHLAKMEGSVAASIARAERTVDSAEADYQATLPSIDCAAPIDEGVRKRTTWLLVSSIVTLGLFICAEFYVVAGPFVGGLPYTQTWFGALVTVWPASGTTLVLLTAFFLWLSKIRRDAWIKRMLGAAVGAWLVLLLGYGLVGGGLQPVGDGETRQWVPMEALTLLGPLTLAIASYCLKDAIHYLWKRRFPLVPVATPERVESAVKREAALVAKDGLLAPRYAVERLKDHLRSHIDRLTDGEFARVNAVRRGLLREQRNAALRRKIRELENGLDEE